MYNKAFLKKEGEYTIFSYGDTDITFYTGKNLDRYTALKEWDQGYIVVMCKNLNNPDSEEEDYIDLLPILDNLRIDANEFLKPIKEVVLYDE